MVLNIFKSTVVPKMAVELSAYVSIVLLVVAVASGQEEPTTTEPLSTTSSLFAPGADPSATERTCLDTLRIGYDSQLTTEHPVHIGSNCSDICIGAEGPVPDGSFHHPGDCRAYIHCQNWEAEAVLCPDFHYFDTTTNECVQAAADDEARREQCRVRVFTTKSPTTTESSTRGNYPTMQPSPALIITELSHEHEEDSSTMPPITPPEWLMKVIIRVRPATSTQLSEPISPLEKNTFAAATSKTTTTATTATSRPQEISEIATELPTTRSPSATSLATEEATEKSTAKEFETTRQLFVLASSPRNISEIELPVTKTSNTSTTYPPTTSTFTPSPSASTATSIKPSNMVAGTIPEFKRSRFYLPGTLYRPPIIQRPKTL